MALVCTGIRVGTWCIKHQRLPLPNPEPNKPLECDVHRFKLWDHTD